MLPGPTILSTLGTLCVPKASAAMACAPPARTTVRTPASFAAARMGAGTLPSGPGGVVMTMVSTPAILAGMASISTLEG